MILWTFVEWKYIKYYKRSRYVKESMVIICQIGNVHKIIKECVCWEGESCLLSPCRLGCWGLWRILVFLYTSNSYSIISTSKVSFFLTQLRKCFSFFFWILILFSHRLRVTSPSSYGIHTCIKITSFLCYTVLSYFSLRFRDNVRWSCSSTCTIIKCWFCMKNS